MLPRWRLNATPERFCFTVEDAAYASHARSVFQTYLRRYAASESDVDAAELIFGELVANVARHAPGPIRASLEWTPDGAVLEVRDTGPGFDFLASLPPDDAENHRGLYIVSVLAGRVVQRRGEDGTVMAVDLPVRKAGTGAARP